MQKKVDGTHSACSRIIRARRAGGAAPRRALGISLSSGSGALFGRWRSLRLGRDFACSLLERGRVWRRVRLGIVPG